MTTSIFGDITLHQLERAVRLSSENESYNSLLFFTYLQQTMLKLARTNFVDYNEVRKALALFQIELVSPSQQKTEYQAVIDRKAHTISWQKEFPGVIEYITVSPGGKSVEKKKYKTHSKINRSKQRPFSELPPELQEKIKNRRKK